MTHRAEQIVDAAVTLIAAQASLGISSSNVYAHRTLTLADDQGEMPAATVDFGDDDPVSDLGTDNVAFIDSLLELVVITFSIEETEALVKTALMNHRRRVHQALMADQSLGLSFVMATRYAGATAPEYDASTERIAGRLETRWRVLYRMNVLDPGD